MNIKRVNRYEWTALDVIGLLREDLKRRKIKLSARTQFRFVADETVGVVGDPSSRGYGVVAEDNQNYPKSSD